MKEAIVNNNRINKKGFSLLELILVLGIIASLVVVAFIMYPKLRTMQRVEAGVKSLSLIKNVIDTNSSVSKNLTWLTTENMIKMQVVPKNMVEGNKIISPWGGEINVSTMGGSSQYYLIEYTQVPIEDCIGFLSLVAKSGDIFSQVRGNGLNINFTGDRDLSIITTFCSSKINVVSGSKTISFSFSDFGNW
ncbi:TPA: prepilin-type N-terminal cleavage/methylation domain-containing protein [Klebsiella michiganensis]|nr:prepilin-type N-terminal cleavage/methylation domain-containing protein [Klebsiella michiganensis]HCB1847501.1 prepilin-type N-terminal cleavage/methylation domain-containing protein [Klebsiella oxytoca]